jgi:hypothetical protein
MLSAFVHWRCEHGKRRDESCPECVASLLFDLKYRPKRYNARLSAKSGWRL